MDDIKALRAKTIGELKEAERSARQKLHAARLGIVVKNSKNVKEIYKIKKYIARILTFCNEKRNT
ncbi:MAG: 50S ribosomal protein L29 [Parcubacteria group bacterium]|nr:50S ribosomal protein L29 [Parcubacteria group bacterium]